MNPTSQIKNEIGNRYGSLTVVDRDKNSGTKAKWVCICDCGNNVSVVGYDLRSGKTKSCGCIRYKNELLKRYGSLLVVEFHKERSIGNKNGGYWICKCDCGKEISVSGHSLRSGNTKSCGHNHDYLPGESSFVKLIRLYKYGAKRRRIPFGLTESEFFALTQQNCHYCGEPPSNKYIESKYDIERLYSGIDRIDSSAGYTVENCVPCCKRCNWAKGTSSRDEYLSWLNRVSERRYRELCCGNRKG